MSAGFGFSVGDFIAAVNLLRQVGKALKDNGGARDDYLKTITKLEVTRAILSCIANFGDSDKDLATVHAIHSLASLIQNDVERFLTKIEKYQSPLGNVEAKGFGRGTVAKIRWSQSVAGEVRRLYQDLDGKTDSLGLLFDLHLSNISARGCKDLASAREAILHAIDNQVALSTIQVRPTSNDALLKQDIDVLATDLRGLVANHAKASNDMLSSMATKDDIQALRLMFESRSQLALPSQNSPLVLQDTSRLNLVLLIPQLQLSFKEATSILQNFSAEVTAILNIFLASFLVCFKDLLLALPQLILLCRVMRRLPPAISLVLHDNITFEDALGRVQSLQFQQFRHWDVFEASLRCAFELVPGKQKVISGDYVLTSPGHMGRLTPRNWSLAVRPGFAVKMAIFLRQVFADGQRCPRGCGSATSKMTTTDYCCGTCGLLFAVRKRSDNVYHEEPLSDSDSEMSVGKGFKKGRTSFGRHQISNISQYNVESTPKTFSLSEETEELEAFKRIELAETPSKSQQSVMHTSAPTQQHQMDVTGQVAPTGFKLEPRVTVTLWEDEGTLCFQVDAKGVCVARREDNHFINGTKLLNVAGMTRGRRDGILKSERTRHVVKIGPMHLKGVWIPYERALDFANKEKITDLLYPLFVHNIGALLYNPPNTNQTGQFSTDQNIRNDMNFLPNQSTIGLDDSIDSGWEYLQAPTVSEFTGHDSASPVSFQSAWLNSESHQAGIHESPAAQHRRSALEDYQMQLMLLEQQNKKRVLQARQESESGKR